jgi:uncharacterized membrane protein
MGMHLHELHAAAVHAPLVLLPTAAAVDLAAAITGNRSHARLGRTLWIAGSSSALFAGLAGAAASQEVRARDPNTSDMLWLHGIGNLGLIAGAAAIAVWRVARPPSVTVSVLGLAASAISGYTAYLGGEMVYGHGVGIRAMPSYTLSGAKNSPPLLSRRAPGTFLRDAIAGLRWLFGRAGEAARKRPPLARESFGLSSTPATASEL